MLYNNSDTLDPRYSEITPEIKKLAQTAVNNGVIEQNLYKQHRVNRGLRDPQGNGVLTGLTDVSEVQGFEFHEDGTKTPIDGILFFRGYNVDKLIQGFIDEDRFGFEETMYLLLFGELPTRDALENFGALLASYRTLPTSFVRDIIMKSPNFDMMNVLARSVLTLHAYDTRANDISIPNVLRQSLFLSAILPLIAVYGYQTYRHYFENADLFINAPKAELSTSENILRMLRKDGEYTAFEAQILDLSLVLHAEHGGGNNSTFTNHVVSSSGTDTYSAVAASLCSLKGPKHGGANVKVVDMFEDMKSAVRDWKDDEEVQNYLNLLLKGKAFDRKGLIYGIGHAVYSLSDPRAEIFKVFVERFATEKGRLDEFNLYKKVAELAPGVIENHRHVYKSVSANVDFYSGLVYSMLDLPVQLFTPIFAIARIPGWSAHRIEELINGGKIIRPAYMSVSDRREYRSIEQRP